MAFGLNRHGSVILPRAARRRFTVKKLAFGGYSANLVNLGTPHGAIHMAVGMDMGNLVRAAYDPIFFAHHANIDRLWEIWRGSDGSDHAMSEPWDVAGFADTFEFFDVGSPEEPYRVSVAQTRNTVDLGYTYSTLPKKPPAMAKMASDEGPGSGPDTKLLGKRSQNYNHVCNQSRTVFCPKQKNRRWSRAGNPDAQEC